MKYIQNYNKKYHRFSPEDESRLLLKHCECVLMFSDSGKRPGTD